MKGTTCSETDFDGRLTPFGISFRSIVYRRNRSLLLIALVAFTSLTVTGGSLIAFSIMNGVDVAEKRLGADVMIVPFGTEADMEGVLLRGAPGTFYLPEGIEDAARGQEGIERVSPQLYIATFNSSHCAMPVQVIGFDPQSDFVVGPWIEQTIPGGASKGEVIVGSDINRAPGDSFLMFGRDYEVTGKLDKTGMGFDRSVFLDSSTVEQVIEDYGSYEDAVQLPDGADTVSVLMADVSKGQDITKFAEDMRDRFRSEGVGILLPKDMLQSMSANLSLIFTVIAILLIVIWAMSLIVLATVFTFAVNERRGEFGILRALGATRKKLARVILAESFVIGIVGAAAGSALSLLIVLSFGDFIGSEIPLSFLLPSAGTTIWIGVAGFLAAFVVGPLASIAPAFKIGRSEVFSVIREAV
ncbi:MAG: FtsX-like permease family protein [Clostridiales Family XIII bacterium]|jgi:putative ABC transport system permease protein|nr:FtsX-like permease family protein [Clostridiales Family XIII bacterium]